MEPDLKPMIEIIENSPADNTLQFLLKNVDASYANALRRAMIAEVCDCARPDRASIRHDF